MLNTRLTARLVSATNAINRIKCSYDTKYLSALDGRNDYLAFGDGMHMQTFRHYSIFQTKHLIVSVQF